MVDDECSLGYWCSINRHVDEIPPSAPWVWFSKLSWPCLGAVELISGVLLMPSTDLGERGFEAFSMFQRVHGRRYGMLWGDLTVPPSETKRTELE